MLRSGQREINSKNRRPDRVPNEGKRESKKRNGEALAFHKFLPGYLGTISRALRLVPAPARSVRTFVANTDEGVKVQDLSKARREGAKRLVTTFATAFLFFFFWQ